MLVVCLAVAVLCVPVVTALAAFAAGCRHLNRFIDHEATSLPLLARDFWLAWTQGWGWAWSAGASVLVLVGAADLALLLNQAPGFRPPGGALAAALTAAVVVLVLVVMMWAAAVWEPGSRWREVAAVAARQALVDWPGSGLVATGLLVSAVLVWMLPVLVILGPGLWCFAVVATDRRDRRTGQDGHS
jgi:hypothetical protein